MSLANPGASLLGSVAFTSGARDIVTPVTARGDLIFGTTGNVTGTSAVNVLGSLSDTTTYGGSPATLSLPCSTRRVLLRSGRAQARQYPSVPRQYPVSTRSRSGAGSRRRRTPLA